MSISDNHPQWNNQTATLPRTIELVLNSQGDLLAPHDRATELSWCERHDLPAQLPFECLMGSDGECWITRRLLVNPDRRTVAK